jgi:hypothetical protein
MVMPIVAHAQRALLIAGAAALFLGAFAACAAASTPWALIARKAVGRVEQLSQAPKGDQPGFDVATVVLDADAAKVYATATGMLHRNQQVQVVAEDPAHRTVNFSNGIRTAAITVNDLGPHLSQMVVAAAVMPGQASATAQIVDGILRVCQQMKVACSAR